MEVVIEIVGEGFGFLLEQGEYVLAALVASGVLVAWILRRRSGDSPVNVDVKVDGPAQTNVMSNVRAKGDVSFSPRQDSG